MKDINVTDFKREEDFEELYYSTSEPNEQIALLANWRKHQLNITSKFVDQIKLIAHEQYSNLDHFILELLQNADDNAYSAKIPTVKISLYNDKFILQNNEVGFNAENLYAITYSAASTKTRDKTAATYIGEKGIGFKSVFSVADYVDIHSSPYHFRLKNDEFIIPHPIPPVDHDGTLISIYFKSNDSIPKILANSLELLINNTQEFTLFLQKIERLEIQDNILKNHSIVDTIRDKENDYYIVQRGDEQVEYVTKSYKKTIPQDVVLTRFNGINADLEREIIFAIPLLNNKHSHSIPKGKIFCYLPTNINIEIPIHIQVDAKTITNRENIVPFNSSAWNKEIFSDFVSQMTQMYVDLTKSPKIKNILPLYLPFEIEDKELINKDIHGLLNSVRVRLMDQPIFLDRHGNFKCKNDLVILPQKYEIFAEDRYESLINEFQYYRNENDTPITFISLEWSRNYKEILYYYEVEDLDNDYFFNLIKEKPPIKINIENNVDVRKFLNLVMDEAYENSFNIKELILSCSIFPVLIDNKRQWLPFDSETYWMHSDSPSKKAANNVKIIDPEFTYSPGGSITKKSSGKEIQIFNKRFREFLTDYLEIKAYSLAEFYKRTIIKQLQDITFDSLTPKARRHVEELWCKLYLGIWKRKKTIINSESEKYWEELFAEISRCKIVARDANTKEWMLTQVNLGFIGPQFKTKNNLEKIYSQTNAPIIRFNFMQNLLSKTKSARVKKIDWEDWKGFLLECDSEEGGYFIQHHLEDDPIYSYSGSKGYKDENNHFAKAILSSINNYPEYRFDYVSSFRLVDGSYTKSLDEYSLKLVENETVDFLANRLSIIWDRLDNKNTIINFIWGAKYKPRHRTVEQLLVFEQIKNGLLLKSDTGYVNSHKCFENNSLNRKILSGIAPLVDLKINQYNKALLSKIGFNHNVSLTHLVKIIQSWYQSEDSRTADKFLPYLKAISAFGKEFPNQIHLIKLKNIFYSISADKLLNLLEWKNSLEISDYPEAYLNELYDSLHIQSIVDYNEIIYTIFGINTLSEETFNALAELSKFTYSVNPEEIATKFLLNLSSVGLWYNNVKILSPEQLPIIWDCPPLITPNQNFIILPSKFWNDKSLYNLIRSINWRTTSTVNIKCIFDSTKPLSEPENIKLHLVLNEILTPLGNGESILKSSNINIFNSLASINQNIFIANEIKIEIQNGKNNLSEIVPYWFYDGKLIISSSQKLEKVIPEFIDFKCGTTFRSTFKYVWNDESIQEKVHAFVNNKSKPATDSNGSNLSPLPPKEPSAPTVPGNIVARNHPVVETSSNPPVTSNDDEASHSGTRKRLLSYVTHGASSNGNSSDSSPSQNHNETIENAGVKILKEYFYLRGINIESVEEENLGYDFEFQLNDQMYYLELKSSRDKWENWEHALTSNEFRKAQHFKDKYILCLIDSVLSDKPNKYFIQNPAGKVDSFLFDSPWKEVAIDFDAILQGSR